MSDKIEKDLDELLDSALSDFKISDTNGKEGEGEKKSEGAQNGAGDAATTDDPDAFFLEQAKLVAERMSTLFGGAETPSGDMPPMPQSEEQMMSGFQKMAEAAAMTLQGENPATDEEVAKCSDIISQALMGLQEGTQGLQNPVSADDATNMFSALNLDALAEGDGNSFLPFMEGMMQSLLSAEILLPSIKELVEKYPKYLEENADKLSPEDKERYEKQLELYKVIEGHLENEKADDSASVKREKFKVVLDDMRKLQEFGQPPEEILAETTGDMPALDPSIVGAAANGPGPQCPTM